MGAALLLALTTVLAVSPPRPAHAVAPSGNFFRLIPPGGQFKPGDVVEWGFFFTNSDGIGQADNPGDEIVVVLPPQVLLISASFSGLGALSVDVPTNTVTVNRALGPLDVQLLTIISQIKPGAEGQTVIGSATINFDADVNGTNESTATYHATPFTVASASTSGTSAANTQSTGGRDDGESRSRMTARQRREKEQTNRLGSDNFDLEGNVVALHLDDQPPAVVVANRDGDVLVVLHCRSSCPTIRVGDYLRASGTKAHEQLFYADNISVERR